MEVDGAMGLPENPLTTDHQLIFVCEDCKMDCSDSQMCQFSFLCMHSISLNIIFCRFLEHHLGKGIRSVPLTQLQRAEPF